MRAYFTIPVPAPAPAYRVTAFEYDIRRDGASARSAGGGSAKALGVTIPPSLLLRADQVIDP